MTPEMPSIAAEWIRGGSAGPSGISIGVADAGRTIQRPTAHPNTSAGPPSQYATLNAAGRTASLAGASIGQVFKPQRSSSECTVLLGKPALSTRPSHPHNNLRDPAAPAASSAAAQPLLNNRNLEEKQTSGIAHHHGEVSERAESMTAVSKAAGCDGEITNATLQGELDIAPAAATSHFHENNNDTNDEIVHDFDGGMIDSHHEAEGGDERGKETAACGSTIILRERRASVKSSPFTMHVPSRFAADARPASAARLTRSNNHTGGGRDAYGGGDHGVSKRATVQSNKKKKLKDDNNDDDEMHADGHTTSPQRGIQQRDRQLSSHQQQHLHQQTHRNYNSHEKPTESFSSAAADADAPFRTFHQIAAAPSLVSHYTGGDAAAEDKAYHHNNNKREERTLHTPAGKQHIEEAERLQQTDKHHPLGDSMAGLGTQGSLPLTTTPRAAAAAAAAAATATAASHQVIAAQVALRDAAAYATANGCMDGHGGLPAVGSTGRMNLVPGMQQYQHHHLHSQSHLQYPVTAAAAAGHQHQLQGTTSGKHSQQVQVQVQSALARGVLARPGNSSNSGNHRVIVGVKRKAGGGSAGGGGGGRPPMAPPAHGASTLHQHHKAGGTAVHLPSASSAGAALHITADVMSAIEDAVSMVEQGMDEFDDGDVACDAVSKASSGEVTSSQMNGMEDQDDNGDGVGGNSVAEGQGAVMAGTSIEMTFSAAEAAS